MVYIPQRDIIWKIKKLQEWYSNKQKILRKITAKYIIWIWKKEIWSGHSHRQGWDLGYVPEELPALAADSVPLNYQGS